MYRYTHLILSTTIVLIFAQMTLREYGNVNNIINISREFPMMTSQQIFYNTIKVLYRMEPYVITSVVDPDP
jgi:hypothetical protein